MSSRVGEIAGRASQLAGAARVSFITEACGTDGALRAAVEAELRVLDGGLVTAEVEPVPPAADPDATVDAAGSVSGAGDRLGRYRLLEPLGEGGFGTVWLAEQVEPVKRRVALKVIKLGMDTKQVIARFEAERQALALMDHPSIAKVFDAGATDSGRPYFVMEHIKGIPITEYCDQQRVDTRGRLELFMQVCEAIQHAHQKGIIHRDIKPSNVLVSFQDGVAVPKVIDFGIAKATNASLTAHTLFTQQHQMIGSPAYMSPEQAGTTGLDIDTRSDLYSLGVLLYELLTGTTPFDLEELLSKGYAGILQHLREVEPKKPSTRLSTLGDTITRTADVRRTSPGQLRSLLRGDLDWIVMKCLEKDRTRRYETASALATEVRRHLTNQPVDARPPDVRYRVAKFVRRNRALVFAAVFILFSLVLGVVGSTYGLLQAIDRRTLAEQAERDSVERAKELARVVEYQQDQLAELDADALGATIRERIAADLTDALDQLRVSDEERLRLRKQLPILLGKSDFTGAGIAALDAHLFGESVDTIESRFADQPVVRATLLLALGESLSTLGLLDRAEAPIRSAFETRRDLLGPNAPETLLASVVLGKLYVRRGKVDLAEPLVKGALELAESHLGPDHPATQAATNGVATLYDARGDFPASEPYHRRALEGFRRTLGSDSPDAISAVSNLAICLARQGKMGEAEPLFRDAIERGKRVLGMNDSRLLAALSSFATLLNKTGRSSGAEPILREVVEIQTRRVGRHHPATLTAINNLGVCVMELGKNDEALALLKEQYEVTRDTNGADDPATMRSLTNYGTTLLRLERYAQAAPLLGESTERHDRNLGSGHPGTLMTRNNYIECLLNVGDAERAEPESALLIEAARKNMPPGMWQLGYFLSNRTRCLTAVGRYAEAEPCGLEAYRIVEATLGKRDHQAFYAGESLRQLYAAWNDSEPTSELAEKLADWSARNQELGPKR